LELILQKRKIIILILVFIFLLISGFVLFRVFYKKDDKKILNIWVPWNEDSDIKNELLEVYKVKYEKENDVLINVKKINQKNYMNEIKNSFKNDEVKSPDIFMWWGGKDLEDIAKSKDIVELDKYLSQNKLNSFGNTLIDKKNVTNYLNYKNKLYAIPYSMYLATLFVNEEMFEKNGIELPTTYGKLLRSCIKFRDKDITPVALPGEDKWSIQLWLNNLHLNRIGYEKYNDFMENGFIENSEILSNSVDDFRSLINYEAFEKNFKEKKYGDSVEKVLEGEIPMILMGNWIIGEFQSNSNLKVKDKIIPMKFPDILTEEGSTLVKNNFLGGAIESFAVSSKSDSIKESVAVAYELGKYISIEGYKKSKIIPLYNISDIEKDNLEPLFRRTIDTIENSEGNAIWWDVYMGKEKGDKVLDSLDYILKEEYNEEEFLNNLKIDN
jgi:raffinose/stachyose/melibiose transport system substrate-binding protein